MQEGADEESAEPRSTVVRGNIYSFDLAAGPVPSSRLQYGSNEAHAVRMHRAKRAPTAKPDEDGRLWVGLIEHS